LNELPFPLPYSALSKKGCTMSWACYKFPERLYLALFALSYCSIVCEQVFTMFSQVFKPFYFVTYSEQKLYRRSLIDNQPIRRVRFGTETMTDRHLSVKWSWTKRNIGDPAINITFWTAAIKQSIETNFTPPTIIRKNLNYFSFLNWFCALIYNYV
jgi:hypothetical protein